MRRFVLALVCIAAADVAACTPAAPVRAPRAESAAPADAPAKKPPVVVTIVVDQLAAWVIDERLRELPAGGGFARLAREGTRVREMRYAHAVTDTAPGHSALYTGATPRVSGIFGNEIVELSSGKRVSVLADASATLVGAAGPIADARGSSTTILRADTVADVLRAAEPRAFIAAMSIKDRGAIFAGGRAPDASIWYDIARGAWVTSTAFARELPAWAKGSPLAPFARTPEWTLLDPPWVKAHALTADDAPGEGDYAGLGTVFPHPLARAREPNVAFRASPAADEALLGLALGALADPRAHGRPTLLALSLSANDYVGHVFGPDSWEAWDELRRLDDALARFFTALDARLGADGYAVLLSGDHGTVRMPEAYLNKGCAAGMSMDHWQRPCDPGVRILPDELAAELQSVAARELGAGRWVAGVADPYVYLTPDARALDPKRRDALLDALRKALLARAGVAAVYRSRDGVAPSCAPDADESVDALVCRSLVPDRGGELYVVTKPGSFFDPSVVVGKGTSHGTPYLFDRAVPLFARAPGRIPASEQIDAPVGFGAFARTAAALLGVPPPSAAQDALDLTSPRSGAPHAR